MQIGGVILYMNMTWQSPAADLLLALLFKVIIIICITNKYCRYHRFC